MIGSICRQCGKLIREHTKQIYIPKKDRKDNGKKYKTVILAKTYLLSYCSDECFKKYKNNLEEKRKEGNKKRNSIMKKNPKCLIPSCKKKAVCVHHIVPIFCGGTNKNANIAPLCQLHHNMVHHVGMNINGKYRYFNSSRRKVVKNFLEAYQKRKKTTSKKTSKKSKTKVVYYVNSKGHKIMREKSE